ncbi:putative nfrkb [Hibiscus syriacus]|uniref:Nfrkb n=1 Tax=Hibiscus syriacus TaxID=106335 RepID=A0A6A2XEG2_HIBSY|nr:putative nfrkb [Hibiscus syriacus]
MLLNYEQSWKMLLQMSQICLPRSATEELRGRLGKLKDTYVLGIIALDILALKLDVNSKSTFGDLNSEVSKHSHDLEDLFKGIASEADARLNDLQSSLYKQEEKLTAFALQARDMHTSKLTKIVEEAQTLNDNKLSEFEKKFEECAINEEKQLLQKVAELLADSSARKKKLVQMAVHDLKENITSKTSELMSIMQESTFVVKTEWKTHMGSTESHYVEDVSAVECGKKDMEDVLQNCLKQTKMSAQQWRNALESLLSLEKRNVDSVDSIVSGGMEANRIFCDQFSSAVSAALEDVNTENNSCLTSIDHSIQLDRDACGNMNAVIFPSCDDLRNLKGGHYHKIVEITENAAKCLDDEYMVDKPSCSTPRKRSFNLPSVSSIDELKTPFEELLKFSWEAKSAKLANGDVKAAYEALKDSRLPLTTINKTHFEKNK